MSKYFKQIPRSREETFSEVIGNAVKQTNKKVLFKKKHGVLVGVDSPVGITAGEADALFVRMVELCANSKSQVGKHGIYCIGERGCHYRCWYYEFNVFCINIQIPKEVANEMLDKIKKMYGPGIAAAITYTKTKPTVSQAWTSLDVKIAIPKIDSFVMSKEYVSDELEYLKDVGMEHLLPKEELSTFNDAETIDADLLAKAKREISRRERRKKDSDYVVLPFRKWSREEWRNRHKISDERYFRGKVLIPKAFAAELLEALTEWDREENN